MTRATAGSAASVAVLPASRRRPRAIATWIVSLLIAGVAGAAISVAALQYDPTVVATLSEASELGVPPDLDDFDGEVTRFEDYLGVTVVTSHAPGTGDTPTGNCVMVKIDNFFQGGCTADDFEAFAEITIGEGSGVRWARLRERHGDNAVLRFTHTGGQVVVRASDPGETITEPQSAPRFAPRG
ncbi:hypothetical protein [Microbacterium sp. cx-59]|uniref:hypothetical protein n=1 Tax=Microbacterium sp. cx-59 TaxID=2891207 RepID=UPI001E6130BB|nr:hypothetical protein [Microbacterium sp. cx-59]MCC4908546.1 hypothetical protein [Microbacterium sp. cx-59]